MNIDIGFANLEDSEAWARIEILLLGWKVADPYIMQSWLCRYSLTWFEHSHFSLALQWWCQVGGAWTKLPQLVKPWRIFGLLSSVMFISLLLATIYGCIDAGPGTHSWQLSPRHSGKMDSIQCYVHPQVLHIKPTTVTSGGTLSCWQWRKATALLAPLDILEAYSLHYCEYVDSNSYEVTIKTIKKKVQNCKFNMYKNASLNI